MANIKNKRKASIDSLKYRIPLHELTSYDHSVNEELITVSKHTGEIEKEFKKTAKQYDCKEYSFRGQIENTPWTQGTRCDVMAIGINAKQLQSKYFEGITKDNIEFIYDQIIELGIINCSLETFINEGVITDMDVKKDFPIDMDNFKQLISGCNEMTKLSKKTQGGNSLETKPTHYGIYWGGTRGTTKFKTYPFTKIYHKTIQMSQPKAKGGMLEFTNAYLNDYDNKDLMRIETTVKNREHLMSLKVGLKKCNLKEILDLNQKSLDKILAKAFNQHLNRDTSRIFKKESTMTPSKEIIFSTLCMLINDCNYSFDKALKGMIRTIKAGSNKTLKKQEITRIYEDYIYKRNYDNKKQIIEDIFDEIGLV